MKSLKVEREIAQFAVDERIIKAPVAGTIVYRLKDPGEAIGGVEPLFEIIDDIMYCRISTAIELGNATSFYDDSLQWCLRLFFQFLKQSF